MKLLLLWLLGVPVLVASMVLASQLPAKSNRATHASAVSVVASSEIDLHHMA